MNFQDPIKLTSVLDLSSFGVSAQSFRFGSLTMESDRYIAIKDTGADNSTQLVVIDMHDKNSVMKKPMKAEASIMNPVDNIIALRGKTEGQAGHFIQVFDLGGKAKLGVHQFSENISLWKWISSRELAVASETSVYHWKVDDGSSPVVVFERAARLADPSTQLILYAVDRTRKWGLLTGIYTDDQGKTINGSLQLYSTEKQQHQILEGHAGCFGNLVVEESKGPQQVFAFCEKKKDSSSSRIYVIDIYNTKKEGSIPLKVSADIQYSPDAPSDFPVFMHICDRNGFLYLVSKAAHLFVFDALTVTQIFRISVSPDPVFVCCESRDGGILAVNRKGHVFQASVNEDTVLSFILHADSVVNKQAIAAGLARRYGLPGADTTLVQHFNQCFAVGDYKAAARIAATMKSGALRTVQTIQQFKSVQNSNPALPSPILQYFSTLLEYGSLSKIESIELVKPVVVQGRREFIEKWLKSDKLDCSEELGDLIRPLDDKLAQIVYMKGRCHKKVIASYIEVGQFDKIVPYAKENSFFDMDFPDILRTMCSKLSCALISGESAAQFVKQILEVEPTLVDANTVVDALQSHGRYHEITAVLIDYLKGNKPEHGHLQTKLLERSLMNSPQVAETIFQSELFSHYDRQKVAGLCEKVGLYQRALEHYVDLIDVKRVLSLIGSNVSAEWMIQFCSKMSAESCYEVMSELLRSSRNQKAVLQTVVQMAVKFKDTVGAVRIINLFESQNSWEGMFFFLGAILSVSQDPEVHFKYIEAAAKVNHFSEVERACRESQYYDPVKVKQFLKQSKLPDPRPLIYVCDLHGFVSELAEYLYKSNLVKFIEVYVVKVNPSQAPEVIGTLIDLDCSEEYIKNLLQSVRGACPVGPLVEQVEKRNRLRLLLPWLEARVNEGIQTPELHNAVAKIYIDTNRDPENFLKSNEYYDSKVVGMYCEDRDPHLAFTAYKRAWGSCDDELINVTNRNGLYRLQARYLVERQSAELWQKVLADNNDYRRFVIDQVVSTALPESSNADEVSAAVKAFIAADLPNELMELLEKIVLHNSDFSSNRNLQNLLILTAIKADKSRVRDYVNRLDSFDGPEIAKIAKQYDLYEEAFIVYKKFNMNAEGIETLLCDSSNLERAIEFANRCDQPEVWVNIADSLLAVSRVPEAIDAYLKAGSADNYRTVINAALNSECYEELVSYLQMARRKGSLKDQIIDTELMFALAKADRLDEMEEFVMGTNTANVQAVGDRLVEHGDFVAAKILFSTIPNNSKLAACHISLGEFNLALEAAKKANNPTTWKAVCFAALEANEMKCAHTAGLGFIVHPDHIDELIYRYEKEMKIEELTHLLESGVNTAHTTHIGLYTELAVIYAKYNPDKLMNFCKTIVTPSTHVKVSSIKLNIPKLINVCEQQLLWEEAVFLYVSYDEYDQAASLMMQHSTVAWNNEEFVKVMQRVSNSELYYQAISFYVDEHPLLLNSMLQLIEKKLDHTRVVGILRKSGNLFLIQSYLESVQSVNISAVSEALIELYLELEDHISLSETVSLYDNFDQLTLASKLEKHEVLEMRSIAIVLYKKNKKYNQAISMCKNDELYIQAMQTARDSASQSTVEDLLKYFVQSKNKECFCACLYICYDLVCPDAALELAWKSGYMDQAMPYLLQVLREYSHRVDLLDKKVEHREMEEEKQKSAPNDYVPDFVACMNGPSLPVPGNLALMPPPAQGNTPQLSLPYGLQCMWK